MNDHGSIRSDSSSRRFAAARTHQAAAAEHASAAEYLGCSFWTARDYILQGLIQVIDMPALRPREGDRQRKTLRHVLSIGLTWTSLSNRKRR